MKYLLLIFISISLTTTLLADYNATKNADDLGMYYQDYNSMMALTGILIGFIIMFGMIFLTIKIGASK